MPKLVPGIDLKEMIPGGGGASITTGLERNLVTKATSGHPSDGIADRRLCQCTGTAERVEACLSTSKAPIDPTGNDTFDQFRGRLAKARGQCATEGLEKLAMKAGDLKLDYSQ